MNPPSALSIDPAQPQWFHNFSTFAGRPGLYLENLFVRPAFRGRGYGEALLRYLAHGKSEEGAGKR